MSDEKIIQIGKDKKPTAEKQWKYKPGHVIELSDQNKRVIVCQIIFKPGTMVQGPQGTLQQIAPNDAYCVQMSGMAQPCFPNAEWLEGHSILLSDFGFK